MFLVIDMQHIYYRCWYTRDKYDEIISKTGRNVAHVKAAINECLKIISDFTFHYDETEAAVCVCLDRDTSKKVMYPEYKANRQGRLDADNYAEIEYIAKVLERKGATLYAEHGYEADDLIYSLIKDNPDTEIAVYTSDADMLMHVNEYTDVWLRRKSEYVRVKAKRYAHQMAFIGKRDVAIYNDTVLYKSCVGDPSDNIKGVKGYGDKAYLKTIEPIAMANPDLEIPTTRDGVHDFAEKYMGFSDEQFAQFEQSLGMVFPLYCEGLTPPVTISISGFEPSKK